MNNKDYRTIEEIRQRKQELRRELDRDSRQMNQLWSRLFVKRDEASRGDFIANIISHGAMAIDAFLMVRKLRRNYNALFRRKKRS